MKVFYAELNEKDMKALLTWLKFRFRLKKMKKKRNQSRVHWKSETDRAKSATSLSFSVNISINKKSTSTWSAGWNTWAAWTWFRSAQKSTSSSQITQKTQLSSISTTAIEHTGSDVNTHKSTSGGQYGVCSMFVYSFLQLSHARSWLFVLTRWILVKLFILGNRIRYFISGLYAIRRTLNPSNFNREKEGVLPGNQNWNVITRKTL